MRDDDLEQRENKTDETTAGGAADRVGEQTPEHDPELLRRDVEDSRAELGGSVEALSPKVGRERAQISEGVAERTAALRERKAALRQRQDELKAQVRERRAGRADGASDEEERTASELAPTPQERPFAAIAVALAVGLVVGWLFGRR